MGFIFPDLPKLSLWDIACLHTGQNACDDKPTNATRHKLAALVGAIYDNKLWVEWPPGLGSDFITGFMPSAAQAKVDTDWRKLDCITVRRDDWERYENGAQQDHAAPRLENEGFSLVSLAMAGVRAAPLVIRFPNVELVTVHWLTDAIGYALVEIPDSWVADTIKKETPVGTDQWRVEPLTGGDWQLVRELCGGNPPSRCPRERIEAWRARFDAASGKPDWNLRVITRSSDEMMAKQNTWLSVARQHKDQIERKAKDGDLSLITPAGIETTDTDAGSFRIADAKDYLDSYCLPWEDAVFEEPSQPDARDLSLIDVTPEQWRAATPEQRLKTIKAIEDTKGMSARRDQQVAERIAQGRYTLNEAAELVTGGSNQKNRLQDTLMKAAEQRDLPVYAPGSTIRYSYGDGVHPRSYFEEAYWNDLNSWLQKNEPRCKYRFDAPVVDGSGPAGAVPSDGSSQSTSTWRESARKIADELDSRDEENGAHDSINSISDRVAKVMRERKINGSRGPLSGTTIKREALQGKKWVRPRDKKQTGETGGMGETAKAI